jgi:hypothetical protein
MDKPADKKAPKSELRRQRLATELRANLLKRKAQARGRSGAGGEREVRPAGHRPRQV